MTRVIIAILVVLVGFVAPTSAQPRYTVTDLGTLGGVQDRSDPRAINALGQVCGNSYPVGGVLVQAFRTEPNAVINPATSALGALGGTGSSCLGMNVAGQAVGYANLPGDPRDSFGNFIAHAFRTDPNQPVVPTKDDLGTLGGNSSTATAINSTGQVAGWSEVESPNVPYRAFRTQPNAPIDPATDDLGTLEPGIVGDYSRTTAMNESGQVVGHSLKTINGAPTIRAFRTGPNARIIPATDDLGSLGGSYSQAEDINNAGQVVGSSTLAGDTAGHAFRTGPNLPINPATDDLGTLPGGSSSVGLGVNSMGDVVGLANTSEGALHMFLYTEGTMYDLNDLIPPLSEWEFERHIYINDLGQITVRAVNGDKEHAFRLDPTPATLLTNLIRNPDLGLNVGGQNSLAALVRQVARAVESGDTARLSKSIDAFIRRVTVLERTGRLTAEQAATIIVAANQILAML